MAKKNVKKIFINNDFVLYVQFGDGAVRSVDLRVWIDGPSKIKIDIEFCKMAFIEHGCIISWPNGVSIDPGIIYDDGHIVERFVE